MLPVSIFGLAWLIIGPLIIRYRRRHRKVNLPGTSVLLDYYTDGVSLIPLSSGMFDDMHYSTIGSLSNPGGDSESSVIYQVLLPFSSYVHLVGVPKQAGRTQLNPAGSDSIMEPVYLEGNYRDNFTLYAEKGMQEDSRYTLDPKAMVFTIDFCQAFSWEIVDNQLYIVQSAGNKASEPVQISAIIVKFVSEIQPAIGRPLTDQEVEKLTPYNEEYRTGLKCPTCQADLVNEQDFMACPHGDGILIKGNALTRLHAGTLQIPKTLLNGTTQTQVTIACPGCGTLMEKVAYNGGKAVIDTCANCPYRWLDASDQIT